MLGDLMRIGVAIPCHEKDKPYLKVCLDSLAQLDPHPYDISINLNKGERSMLQIRNKVIDQAFEVCDVVLACDADLYLFPRILNHARQDRVVSFCNLQRRLLSDIIITGIHLFYPESWAGVFSMPKKIWEQQIKPSWDGSDGSVKEILGRNYKFVRQPMFYEMRPWRKETTDKFLAEMPIIQRLKWRLIRLR